MLIFIAAISLLAAAESSVTPVLRSRVFGGTYAPAGLFPYHVGVRRNLHKPDMCGGSLLSNDWVVTTASCTKNIPSVTVFLGTVSFETGISYDVLPNNIIIHKDYNYVTNENDISLIRIPTTKYSATIQNILLPRTDDMNLYVGSLVTQTGWGINNNMYSRRLRYALFEIQSNEHCSQFFPTIKETQLCVGTTTLQSPCRGDIGGPLALRSPQGMILIGLASFTKDETCNQANPVKYTRARNFIYWINRKTDIPLVPSISNEVSR